MIYFREVISMAIKFATDIINEIKARGSINVPQGYITGEAFEKWLYQDDIFILDTTSTEKKSPNFMNMVSENNEYKEDYGEAA